MPSTLRPPAEPLTRLSAVISMSLQQSTPPGSAITFGTHRHGSVRADRHAMSPLTICGFACAVVMSRVDAHPKTGMPWLISSRQGTRLRLASAMGNATATRATTGLSMTMTIFNCFATCCLRCKRTKSRPPRRDRDECSCQRRPSSAHRRLNARPRSSRRRSATRPTSGTELTRL